MKQLLLIIGLVILVSSCVKVDVKRCWECETKLVNLTTKEEMTSTDRVCDVTKEEIKQYEKTEIIMDKQISVDCK